MLDAVAEREEREERECFLHHADPDPILRHFHCSRRGHDWGAWIAFRFLEQSKPILAYNKRVHFRNLRRVGYWRRCLMCGQEEEVRP